MVYFKGALALLAALFILDCVLWVNATPLCGANSDVPCAGRDQPEIDVQIVENEQKKLKIRPIHHLNVTTQTAIFGMGCFWGVEALWGSVKGVVSTAVGYASGTKQSPTYKNLGDHTEVVEVHFDPKAVTYAELVKIFWDNSPNVTITIRRQYRSIILYTNEEQKKIAEQSRDLLAKRLAPTKIFTTVEAKTVFYLAEDYHQKYTLQQHKRLVESLGLDHNLMKSSHVAAVLNAHLAGRGTMAELYAEIDHLGLTPTQKAYVIYISTDMEGKGHCDIPNHA